MNSALSILTPKLNDLNIKKMRLLIVLILISMFCYNCKSIDNSSAKADDPNNVVQQDTIRIENEELEYEIIIIENGFEMYLAQQPPMSYYSDFYLANKNIFFVSEWNRRVALPGIYNPNLYEQLIQYDFNIDYGKEVNYKLFMYFKFFQKKYNQRL